MNEQRHYAWLDAHWFQRVLEILPGLLSWTFLAMPIILSVFRPILVAYFIIAFDLFWLIKSFRLAINLLRGYGRLQRAQQVDWTKELQWLEDIPGRITQLQQQYKKLPRHSTKRPYVEQQLAQWKDLGERSSTIIDPDEIYNAVIVATYNESMDILEPSIQALTEAEYDLRKLILIIAYEERGGADIEATANTLIKKYGGSFKYAAAIKHPDGLAGEVKGGGKGPNITWAGRQLTEYVVKQGIDPNNVIVTTLDSDHRPSSQYFSQLTFMYATDVNRLRRSYQPIAMFLNNIWDAPAPMRVLAVGNSFFTIVQSVRPHLLRNFSSHSQPLDGLLETSFWSTRSIVEDGHQFWRSYFRFGGNHSVVPIYSPNYQDAVLSDTYRATLKAQFIQLRRWAYGASDIAYISNLGFRRKKDRIVPLHDFLPKFLRLLDTHVSWATAAILLLVAPRIPLLVGRQVDKSIVAYQLPVIASYAQTLALGGLFVSIFLSMKLLPRRPERYKRHRTVLMLAQWVLLPFTSIIYGAGAGLYSQTRLLLGKYLDSLT